MPGTILKISQRMAAPPIPSSKGGGGGGEDLAYRADFSLPRQREGGRTPLLHSHISAVGTDVQCCWDNWEQATSISTQLVCLWPKNTQANGREEKRGGEPTHPEPQHFICFRNGIVCTTNSLEGEK